MLAVVASFGAACGATLDIEAGDLEAGPGLVDESIPEVSGADGNDDQGSDTGAEAPGGSVDPDALDGDDLVALLGDQGLIVLDAGVEPRLDFIFDFEDGRTETMVMTMTQELTQELNGRAMPGAGEVTTIMAMDITTYTDDAGYLVESVVTSALPGEDMPGAMQRELERALAPMVGMTTTVVMDQRGHPLDVEIAGGDTTGTDLIGMDLEQLSQTVPAFPAEPMGVGAVFVSRQIVELAGFEIGQYAVYEVTSIEGTVVTMDTRVVQVVDDGAVMRVQGIEAEITRWEGDLTGTTTMDLTSLVVTSTAGGTIDQGMEFSEGQLEQSITQRMTIGPG